MHRTSILLLGPQAPKKETNGQACGSISISATLLHAQDSDVWLQLAVAFICAAWLVHHIFVQPFLGWTGDAQDRFLVREIPLPIGGLSFPAPALHRQHASCLPVSRDGGMTSMPKQPEIQQLDLLAWSKSGRTRSLGHAKGPPYYLQRQVDSGHKNYQRQVGQVQVGV